MARGKRFDYTPSYDETVARADNKGGGFDNLWKDVKLYTAKEGLNTLRILPPGWEGAKHYGFSVMIHNIGPQGRSRRYFCLEQNDDSPHKRCPICEELRRIRNPDADMKKEFGARSQIAYYIIDRDNPKEGVQLWLTSQRNNTEIAAQSLTRKTKSVLNITHPDDGFDIEFTRTGKTLNNTRYNGFQVMRDSSPVSENDKHYNAWLDEVYEHPIPELMQFYSSEVIAAYLSGKRDDTDDEDEKPSRSSRSRRDAEDDEDAEVISRSRRRPRDEEDDEPIKKRTQSRDEDESEDWLRKPKSRISEEIDDEIPFDGGKKRASAASDDDEEEPKTRRRATKPEEAHEDEEPSPRRSRRAEAEDDDERPSRSRRRPSDDEDDGDEPEEKPSRRPRATSSDDEDDGKAEQKDRLRNRLNRTRE